MEFREEDHVITWQKFVLSSIVNPATAIVTEKTIKSRIVRTFSNVPLKYGKYWHGEGAEVSYPKFYVAFTSSQDDTKIMSASAKKYKL